MPTNSSETKDEWVQWRVRPSLYKKLAPYKRDRQLSHLLDTLLWTFLKDSTGIDALHEENRKLQQTVNDALVKIAANQAQIQQLEMAAQATEVQLAAESRFMEVVKSRDPRRMDVTMWRNLAVDHPTAQGVKMEVRKRIIKETVGVEI